MCKSRDEEWRGAATRQHRAESTLERQATSDVFQNTRLLNLRPLINRSLDGFGVPFDAGVVYAAQQRRPKNQNDADSMS